MEGVIKPTIRIKTVDSINCNKLEVGDIFKINETHLVIEVREYQIATLRLDNLTISFFDLDDEVFLPIYHIDNIKVEV